MAKACRKESAFIRLGTPRPHQQSTENTSQTPQTKALLTAIPFYRERLFGNISKYIIFSPYLAMDSKSMTVMKEHKMGQSALLYLL